MIFSCPFSHCRKKDQKGLATLAPLCRTTTPAATDALKAPGALLQIGTMHPKPQAAVGFYLSLARSREGTNTVIEYIAEGKMYRDAITLMN